LKNISSEEASLLGVDTVHQIMDNGEKRFRLVNKDGSSYIRTEGSKNGSWQNSHYHKHFNELYIVEDGWIVYAELTDQSGLSLKLMKKNDSIIVSPLRHHNIYMSSLAVTHVVKFSGNNIVKPDWFPSSQLDILTKDISESEIVRLITEKTGIWSEFEEGADIL
jgi:mannose-6-phosphate isomerase-like protein (cupin superfamily)